MRSIVVVFGKLGCVALLGLLALPVLSPVNAMRGGGDGARANFNEIDKNADGVITRGEYESHKSHKPKTLRRGGGKGDKSLDRGSIGSRPSRLERERESERGRQR